jgi:hypothetical protein
MGRYLDNQKELDEVRKEKFVQEIEKEQEYMNNFKSKKVAKDIIEKAVDRLYNEAERRKLARDEKIQQIEKHRFDTEEDMPSRYMSRKIPKYNFGVCYF